MAKVLNDAVDLHDHIRALRQEEGEDCGSSAGFLETFLSDLAIPETEAEIPDHFDIPEHCLLEFHANDGFRWSYMRGECPFLSAGHVYEGENNEPYVISFNYENPGTISRNRVNAVEIRIYERIRYGTSAYPLMVWRALGENPQTQAQIARTIEQTWNTMIDRKAIGRHLQLLQDLGYPGFLFFCIANRPSRQKILKISCSVIIRLSGSGTYPSHMPHPEAAACGAYPDINAPDGIKKLCHGHAGVPAIEHLPALDPEDQLKVL